MDREGLPGAGAPIESSFITGGSQNEIFEIRRGDLHCALRTSAAQPAARTRRWDRARVAHHRRAERHGRAPHRGHRAVRRPLRARRRLLPHGLRRRLVAGRRQRAIHRRSTPIPRRGAALRSSSSTASPSCRASTGRRAGLEGLGRPDGFHERQVERWLRFLDRVRTRELPGPRRSHRVAADAPTRSTTCPGSCTATTSSPT